MTTRTRIRTRAPRSPIAMLVALALAVLVGLTGCGTTMRDLPIPGTGVSGDTMEVEAEFAEVLNLAVGAPVKVNGIDMGKVKKIEVKDFVARNGEHSLLEERRLAYVACTRARSRLLLSSWVWGPTGQTPRLPSRFLEEVRAMDVADRVDWAEMPETKDEGNPALAVARHLQESRRFAVPHLDVTMAGHGRRFWLLAASALLLSLFTAPAGQLMNEFLRDERGYSAARISLFTILTNTPGAIGIVIGLAIGARAGVHTPVSACASGNESIALGIDMIRLGRADVVVVGGTEAAVHPLPMAAFGQMMALSKRNDDPEGASRPWDKGRDGFVLGEGAAALVLESEEHARARGAKVYAEAAGAGIPADSHDIAQPDPVGRGATRAMEMALREAHMSPDEVVHINAHATSTPQGDLAYSAHTLVSAGPPSLQDNGQAQ